MSSLSHLNRYVQSTDYELILHHVVLSYGRWNSSFLRSLKRWEPLLPLLSDNVQLHVDLDVDDMCMKTTTSTSSGNPREIAQGDAALSGRQDSLRSMQELRLSDGLRIVYPFAFVEQTRGMHGERFHYSVIKLIGVLNERFMAASLRTQTPNVDV
ncbi:hypothetical protein B0H21DRAFT_823063 [Amylocystis lapponica]|nr:hypothetical protein B0H21DRAFT_823063 [Amylocystis lapponica]